MRGRRTGQIGGPLPPSNLKRNIKRLDIEWQDECMAVFDYHHLRLARDPD
jgi:hypothetical protein